MGRFKGLFSWVKGISIRNTNLLIYNTSVLSNFRTLAQSYINM